MKQKAQILYRYYDLEGGLRSIENQTLRFSRSKLFNDPYDSVPKDVATSYTSNEQADVKHHFNNNFILCFTRSPLNTLMWSHYGKSHTGIVVGYDITKIPELSSGNVISIEDGDVIYPTSRPPQSDKPNKKYLYKSSEWNYEEEVRVVRSFEEKVKIDNKRSIPQGNFSGVLEAKRLWGDLNESKYPSELHPQSFNKFDLKIPPEAIAEVYLSSNTPEAHHLCGYTDQIINLIIQSAPNSTILKVETLKDSWQLDADEHYGAIRRWISWNYPLHSYCFINNFLGIKPPWPAVCPLCHKKHIWNELENIEDALKRINDLTTHSPPMSSQILGERFFHGTHGSKKGTVLYPKGQML
ncbi:MULTISPECIES: DUF2971 domain-containing protein [Colwellia]|uniref:DUF2971 domain-containing protein n=1 Tax=Colwellia marinimaniae TaxID=1513592 RepID=A0ABQ0MX66_9GAMM|nr:MULTISPECIES: DUF2971 domain-containing protein [Colwellia]GAW96236.1 hypothetical protein MTCD1_01850 [Colwellia marinimaniae]